MFADKSGMKKKTHAHRHTHTHTNADCHHFVIIF